MFNTKHKMNKEETLELTLKKNHRYLLKAAHNTGQNDWIPDLVQEGRIALANAYNTYDPSKGTFHSFAATLIKYAMMTYLSNNCRTVRLPNNVLWKEDTHQSYIHLDQPNSEGNTIDLEDKVEDEEIDDTEMHQRKLVMHYLDKLKPQYQLIIKRIVFEEKFFQDVGTELGITREAARQQYNLAIKQLQKLMGD